MIPKIGKEKFMAAANDQPHFLDITTEVCPLTFVRTKLLIERVPAGSIVEIRLNAGEPLLNVPRSVEEHGHRVLRLEPEIEGRTDGVHRLWVQVR